jgi:uncharacterized protein YecE (DUF72 family)
MGKGRIFIGTAGWSIASRHATGFPGSGSHLERYAAQLSCVEINSSFYRPHRRETYERWAASVPDDFRFSVKLPKTVTHAGSLAGTDALLDGFLEGVSGLGGKLALVLVQLPPKLACDPDTAASFFRLLSGMTDAAIAVEPRHASWFGREPETMLQECRVARVGADPPRAAGADQPGGWNGLRYFRLHGSPSIYRSDYGPERLAAIAAQVGSEPSGETWCIFDNTTGGHAVANALTLGRLLRSEPAERLEGSGVAGDAA